MMMRRCVPDAGKIQVKAGSGAVREKNTQGFHQPCVFGEAVADENIVCPLTDGT